MSDILDPDLDIEINDSEIGRKMLFWEKTFPEGEYLGFASKIENIGKVDYHDCYLKNKSEVLVLSDPIEAKHYKLGPILVSKILADKVMYVQTSALIFIN